MYPTVTIFSNYLDLLTGIKWSFVGFCAYLPSVDGLQRRLADDLRLAYSECGSYQPSGAATCILQTVVRTVLGGTLDVRLYLLQIGR